MMGMKKKKTMKIMKPMPIAGINEEKAYATIKNGMKSKPKKRM